MFGGTLRHLFALSQHVGLAQNVHDHRMPSRTIYLHCIEKVLYMNTISQIPVSQCALLQSASTT